MKKIISYIIILLIFTSCIKNGVDKIFKDNGQIDYKVYYKNWEKEKTIFYFENKIKKQICFFKRNGNLREVVNFYKNGNFKNRYYFKNNLRHGISIGFDINGKNFKKKLFLDDHQIMIEEYETIKPGGSFYTGIGDNKVRKYTVEHEFLNRSFFRVNNHKKVLIRVGNLLYKDHRIVNSLGFFYDASIIKKTDSIICSVYCVFSDYKNITFEIGLGELDSDLNFVDSTKIRTIISNKIYLDFGIENFKTGYNLILGKIYFKHNDSIFKEEVFYTDFIVDKPSDKVKQ